MKGFLALLPVWESWVAPLGRWGPYAFPIVQENGKVYVIDGRRIWQFQGGRWEEYQRLPEEVRTGISLGGDTLLIGGLGVVYLVTTNQVRSFSLEGTGWIYKMWRFQSNIAIQGVRSAFLLRVQGDNLVLSRIEGEWLGVIDKGLVLRQGDTLKVGAEGQVLQERGAMRWVEIAQTVGQIWGITTKGEATSLTQRTSFPFSGRTWVGPYLLSERKLFSPPRLEPLWESRSPIYSAASISSLVVLVTATECVFLYPELRLKWKLLWGRPMSQAYVREKEWVVWQGEVALMKEGVRRFSATLIEPTWYEGRWIWATPKGLLEQDGRVLAAAGRYVSTVSAYGARLAWGSGTEVYIRTPKEEKIYRFTHPIRRLRWQGDTLWAWGARVLYAWKEGKWSQERLPFEPTEAVYWGDQWYFKVGLSWFFRRSAGDWDTLGRPPWLPALPLAYSWGQPLWSFKNNDTSFILTSVGLLVLLPEKNGLPPLALEASLEGPALSSSGGKFHLPAERPYVKLRWSVGAPFLPTALRAYYQIGEEPPLRLVEATLLLALSRPGSTTLRLWIEHPWYEASPTQKWGIEVIPPWYQTWWAIGGGMVFILVMIGGFIYLREASHRRYQSALQAEKERLIAQTQLQQVQLLQQERMANLGVMAAHIAHEINTPLGIIQSALAEGKEALRFLFPTLPFPLEPRPSAARLRELRSQWQSISEGLSPTQIQELAMLGYTPEQKPALEPYLRDSTQWSQVSRWLSLWYALERAEEAAGKLYARVQAIRTYVRGIGEATAEPVRIIESIASTIEFYRPLMQQIQVELLAPNYPLFVYAHLARLEQVWANLIQNAIQAMPEGGKLIIRIEPQGENVWVYVQDSGKGIPPESRSLIFEPLYTTKAPGEGTGLGLPLCKQIIEGYGGSLHLLHSEPGYTLFGVKLPLWKPLSAASSAEKGE
ncbi:MAG: HAMP domain-containing sensor histidine kinase [Bacteroidia bacterium]|nr:HAMP domain-containing histidine kinase [Bacteroidia bacterium]MDW8015064.1 HAMP domain-containing sensor histidine kinase [Bacteroidia bacterium]